MAYDQDETGRLYWRAVFRVDHDGQLAQHREFILADWPEGDEHWRWVCDAPTDEILDWVAAGSV